MSFCTGCGNNVDPASKFCDKCGKPMASISAQPTGASAAAATGRAPLPPPPPAKQGGGLLKTLLILFGVLVLLFMIAVGGVVGVAYYAAKHAKVQRNADGSAKIETPFGKIETDDPAKTAEKMGVEVYPGADPVKNGAGSFSMGDFSAGSAQFETTDSVEQVAAYYKEQYPKAVHTESNGNHSFSVTSKDANSKDKIVVINLTPQGSKTSITLTQVIAPKQSR
ncbi:MAG: hypothetical protein ACJ71N_05625 [Terriglobales bacterium]